MVKDLVILGAGGFGREVAFLVDNINDEKKVWNMIGFIDDDKNKQGLVLNNYPVLGSEFLYNYKHKLYGVCAVGNPKQKKILIEKISSANICFTNLVHPSVIKSKYLDLQTGIIICAGNILTVNISIGNHVIINLDCTIGHDVNIKDYCTIAPSANISGNVELGEGCDFGTNASAIQGIQIGEWSVVGAGAVVINDIPPNCTAVGVPAKPITVKE